MSVIMVIGYRPKDVSSPHSDKVAGRVCCNVPNTETKKKKTRAECRCCAPDVKLLHPTGSVHRKLESPHAIVSMDAFFFLKHVLCFAIHAL